LTVDTSAWTRSTTCWSAGQVIDLPERRADRPGREFLEWHLDEVFLKAAER
jgi:putative restriction endonuclease